MYGHDVAWLQNVVAVEQLTGGGVTRHVNLGIALVHHIRTEFGQSVDYAVNGIFVARNERACEYDGIALADFNFVF